MRVFALPCALLAFALLAQAAQVPSDTPAAATTDSSPAASSDRSSAPDSAADDAIRSSLEQITAVFDAVETNFADPVDPERVIYQGALPGAISRLDPFSVFLDKGQFDAMKQQERGVRQGFGAVLSVQSGKVTILQSVPNSPFGRAGLGPGDRIVSINGKRVQSLDLEELVQVLNEARSGKVRLRVLQGGNVFPRDVQMDPAEVPSPSVDRTFLWAPGVGYLHVARIEPGTPDEIRKTVLAWKPETLHGLVLDLRDNPGGEIDAAISIAGLFLPQGSSVTTLRGRDSPEKQFLVEKPPLFPDLPLVVVLNPRSASAAEMIAAALQDHDRAWLVGEPSFGKGVAEAVLPLSEGNALVLTTALYFTPRGRSLQKPLPETALAGILDKGQQEFFTDSGRPIREQGGVEPDQNAEPWRLEQWEEFLQQTTAFVNYAQTYLDRHGSVPENFQVDDATVEDFRGYLGQGRFVPPEQEWRRALPFLRMHLQAEILNLVFGITKGDEAESRADPQLQAAAGAMARAKEILATTKNSTGPK